MSTKGCFYFKDHHDLGLYIHHDCHPENVIPILKKSLFISKQRDDLHGYVLAKFIELWILDRNRRDEERKIDSTEYSPGFKFYPRADEGDFVPNYHFIIDIENFSFEVI